MIAPLEVVVPLKTTNPLNRRPNYFADASKRKRERNATHLLLGGPLVESGLLRPVFLVTLTRLSRGRLDPGAVGAALKSVQDAVAHRLGVDDGGPLVEWRYAQEAGEAGVRVRIEPWRQSDGR